MASQNFDITSQKFYVDSIGQGITKAITPPPQKKKIIIIMTIRIYNILTITRNKIF